MSAKDIRFDYVLCDSDDTLLDFSAACRDAVHKSLGEFGINIDPDSAYAIFRPITDLMWASLERGEITREQLFAKRSRLFSERIGADFDPDTFNGVYRKHLKATRFVLPGAVQMLKELRELGAHLYIITNADAFCAADRLKPLTDYVDGAFVSETLGCSKPSFEFFDKVYRTIGSPQKSRVLVFGDSETSDIKGGRDFGFYTCLYDPTGTKQTKADFTVQNYAELKELLINNRKAS